MYQLSIIYILYILYITLSPAVVPTWKANIGHQLKQQKPERACGMAVDLYLHVLGQTDLGRQGEGLDRSEG